MGEDVFSHNDDSNYYSDDEGCFYPKSTDESCTCDHQQENIIKCTTRHSNSHRQSGHNLKNQPPTDRRHRHRCLNGCPHSAMVDEKTSTTSTTLATPLGLNQLGPSSFELNMVGAHDVSARPVDVTQIQFTPDDIEYRGEGNSSIVVSLAKEGKVIRLLKKSSSVENGRSCNLPLNTRDRLMDIIEFEEKILRRILNNDFLHKPRMVYLTDIQVSTINSIIMKDRPVHRLSKSVPNEPTYALLLPDYCDLKCHMVSSGSGVTCCPHTTAPGDDDGSGNGGGPDGSGNCCWNCGPKTGPSMAPFVSNYTKESTVVNVIHYNHNDNGYINGNNIMNVDGCRYQLVGPVISTEIKPKQGFLPSIESLPAQLEVKARVSRFCLKQFHKMKRGSVSILSDYCPLDLFSGCHRRQRKAIDNLLATPQNNLRIFKNLKLVYGEEKRISFTDLFNDDIITANDSPTAATATAATTTTAVTATANTSMTPPPVTVTTTSPTNNVDSTLNHRKVQITMSIEPSSQYSVASEENTQFGHEIVNDDHMIFISLNGTSSCPSSSSSSSSASSSPSSTSAPRAHGGNLNETNNDAVNDATSYSRITIEQSLNSLMADEKNNLHRVDYKSAYISSGKSVKIQQQQQKATVNDDQNLVKDLYINLILKSLNLSSKQLIDSVSNVNPNTEDKLKIIIGENSICHLHSILGCNCFNSNININCNDTTLISCPSNIFNGQEVLGSVYSAQRLDSVDSCRALVLAKYLVKNHYKDDCCQLMYDLKNKRPQNIGSPCKLTNEKLEEFFFRKVWEFVVSLTAKDCSIMITMQRVIELPQESSFTVNCDEDDDVADDDDDEDDDEDVEEEEEEEEVSSELDLCDSNDSCDSECPREVVGANDEVVDGCDDELVDVGDDVNDHKENCSNDASDDVSHASNSSLENVPFVMSHCPLHKQQLHQGNRKQQLKQQQHQHEQDEEKKKEQKLNGLHLLRDDASGQLFAVAIAITDLDPKLPQTYPELERKINLKDGLMVQSFQEFLNSQPFTGAI